MAYDPRQQHTRRLFLKGVIALDAAYLTHVSIGAFRNNNPLEKIDAPAVFDKAMNYLAQYPCARPMTEQIAPLYRYFMSKNDSGTIAAVIWPEEKPILLLYPRIMHGLDTLNPESPLTAQPPEFLIAASALAHEAKHLNQPPIPQCVTPEIIDTLLADEKDAYKAQYRFLWNIFYDDRPALDTLIKNTGAKLSTFGYTPDLYSKNTLTCLNIMRDMMNALDKNAPSEAKEHALDFIAKNHWELQNLEKAYRQDYDCNTPQ
jgi:hypothetical protein